MHAHIDPIQIEHKAAVSAVTSVTSAVITQFGGIDPMVQLVGGLVAILSGSAAIIYYVLCIIEKVRAWRKP